MLEDVAQSKLKPSTLDSATRRQQAGAAMTPNALRKAGGANAAALKPAGAADAEKWDMTMNGGAPPGRDGRQFTVANVGNNGRIYLRYVNSIRTRSCGEARHLVCANCATIQPPIAELHICLNANPPFHNVDRLPDPARNDTPRPKYKAQSHLQVQRCRRRAETSHCTREPASRSRRAHGGCAVCLVKRPFFQTFVI